MAENGRKRSLHDQAAAFAFRSAKRRRATSATAPAPNSRIIGGAGTSVPPVLPELPPELLEEEDELLDEELEELELPLLLVPKLDEELLLDELEEELEELDDPPFEPWW
ncbi:hypothetical protein FHS51_000970 [Sphingobium wenxiniae]|uniref:Uncharacterized protein n=2 Tax=Sphingobium TaxID=165695 RepID=T0H2K3_9SPHN|nr:MULTISPECIES: hypothetical protein [Sphingobium]EQB06298.1 hypothetical protein L485_01355 [Sphingobium baderi LL03]KMS62671.1 hypothetical protein V475_06840 [Sphingobium baderi LL03]MBB6190753.1 hypothetical protein [Sphingobium wenxiniae]TWH94531.1 hypothetical protein IQ35_01774 [Sphingobium wenxiniae]WRD76795.1 hypothetical protein QQ987_01205 [Sphingobium baderi]